MKDCTDWTIIKAMTIGRKVRIDADADDSVMIFLILLARRDEFVDLLR